MKIGLFIAAAVSLASWPALADSIEVINGNQVTFRGGLGDEMKDCLREAIRSSGYSGSALQYSPGGTHGKYAWVEFQGEHGECSSSGSFRFDPLRCDKWNVIVAPDCSYSGNGGDT